MIVNQQIYRKAFQDYLRTGTSILRSIKQARPTTHYIWRTRRDSKVRSAHADREGQVFSWDNPPAGGHPSEDYGCRCTAEPFVREVNEHISITLSGVSDSARAWTNLDFVKHYYKGNGRDVKLRETGHLRAIVAEYMQQAGNNLKEQIADEARKYIGSIFSYEFDTSYPMTNTQFTIGDTTIGGAFTGKCIDTYGSLKLSGRFEFYLHDEFSDPADIGELQREFGINDAEDVEIIDLGNALYENIHKPLTNYLRGRVGLPSNGRQHLGIHTGEPYSITDNWSAGLEGVVYADRDKSKYFWNG